MVDYHFPPISLVFFFYDDVLINGSLSICFYGCLGILSSWKFYAFFMFFSFFALSPNHHLGIFVKPIPMILGVNCFLCPKIVFPFGKVIEHTQRYIFLLPLSHKMKWQVQLELKAIFERFSL